MRTPCMESEIRLTRELRATTAVVDENPDPDGATRLFRIVTVKLPVVLFSTKKNPMHSVVMVMLADRVPERYRMADLDSAADSVTLELDRVSAVRPPRLSSI